MNSEDDIRTFWSDSLGTIPHETLQQFALPAQTNLFLETVGLPQDERLNRDSKLGIVFLPHNLSLLEYEGERFVVIGILKLTHDFFQKPDDLLCVKEKTGEVFVMTRGIEHVPPIQFVNTDIRCLVLFLKTCLQYKSRMRELAYQIDDLIHQRISKEDAQKLPPPQDEYDNILKIIRQEFLDIDPDALADEGYYWASVLFDWSI